MLITRSCQSRCKLISHVLQDVTTITNMHKCFCCEKRSLLYCWILSGINRPSVAFRMQTTFDCCDPSSNGWDLRLQRLTSSYNQRFNTLARKRCVELFRLFWKVSHILLARSILIWTRPKSLLDLVLFTPYKKNGKRWENKQFKWKIVADDDACHNGVGLLRTKVPILAHATCMASLEHDITLK